MTENVKPVVAFRILVNVGELRVVLDTNLFVAAYWNPLSASARILEACEAREVRLLISAAIRGELFRIIRQARTSASHQERVKRMAATAEEIRPSRRMRLIEEDPEDDKFLECAVEGNADYLVSSDEHLLRLLEVEGVEIVTPGSFARRHLGG